MRAISLWQPWATAIAYGTKKIETRHWSTTYRGPLAIHAAKRWDRQQREFAGVEQMMLRLPKEMPLGAIIATCLLYHIRPTAELDPTISDIERLYGDYAQGRYGWLFTEVRVLREPVPFKGAQGFFNVPDELLK